MMTNADRMLAQGKTKELYVHPALSLLVFIAAVFTFVHSEPVLAVKEHISCAAIRAQGLDPQEVFNKSPLKYARLDRNKDGTVCQ